MSASRTASKAFRGSFAKQLTTPQVQRRTIVSALNAAARPSVAKAAAKPFAAQQIRGVKTVDFAGHKEQVFGASWETSRREIHANTSVRARRLAQGQASRMTRT